MSDSPYLEDTWELGPIEPETFARQWSLTTFIEVIGVALLVIAACFLVALLAFAGKASANGPPPPTPNQVEYWCPSGGVKLEPVDTPFIVPAPPEGSVITLMVLKAGSGEGENETIANPIVGQSYTRTDGRDISHVILCYGPAPTTTTTTTLVTTTTEPEGDPEPTTTTATTLPTTTTTTGTVCGLCAGQFGTTTTVAPTTTVTPTATTAAPTTTVAPASTPAPEVIPPVVETVPAPVAATLPVTGGSPWWLLLFAGCMIALGGLAWAWSRS